MQSSPTPWSVALEVRMQNGLERRFASPHDAVGGGAILTRVPERFVGTVIPDDFKTLVDTDTPGVIDVVSQDSTERVLGYRPIALPNSPSMSVRASPRQKPSRRSTEQP